MRILTVNIGSSSAKLGVVEFEAEKSPGTLVDQKSTAVEHPESGLAEFSANEAFDAVAHRVVHGGSKFTAPCFINKQVEGAIEELSALAPLHNPRALAWIRAAKHVFQAPQVALFDTAFFAELPRRASTYGLPEELCRELSIRRYGFHGLAHEAMSRRYEQLKGQKTGRVVTLQLGSGCSAAALLDGKPIDTSMGFSPLEGLLMSTRPGDLDPSAVLGLVKHVGLEKATSILNEHSGLLGISGISANIKTLLESKEERACLAVEVFCYRIRKYLGAYIAALEGVDAVLLSGGVGENAARIRDNIFRPMAWCGLQLDEKQNASLAGKEDSIHASKSQSEIWIIPCQESRLLAEGARDLLIKQQEKDR